MKRFQLPPLPSLPRLPLLSLVVFIVLLSPAAGACKLTVRFEDYPPQYYLDKNNQWQGMAVDFAKALLHQAGCDYRVIKAPWARALDMLEKGQIDMMLNVSRHPTREHYSYFIGPQRQESIVLISLASAPIALEQFYRLDTWGKPVAIQKGAYYGKRFATMLANNAHAKKHFMVIPNNDVKLSMLHKGRVSGIIDEKLNILYQIKHTPKFSDVVVHPVVVHVNPVYYAFSQASVNPVLLARLNKAFETLQSNQTLAAIVKKYES